MPALRFLLLGYGAAAVLGIGAGGHVGLFWGLMTVWLGGAVLSLLFLFCWFRARTRRERPADREVPGQGWLPAERPDLQRLFRSWSWDLSEEMAAVGPTIGGDRRHSPSALGRADEEARDRRRSFTRG